MKIIVNVLILLILVGCTPPKKYSVAITDFRYELQPHLQKLDLEKRIPSRDTIALQHIQKNCSKEELLQLLNCESPILRAIAFRTLVDNNEKDTFKILLTHLDDTTKVVYWYYEDASENFMVSDLLIRKIEPKLTPNEKIILVDSVLLKYSNLFYSNWMIHDIKPNEKYYSLIKERSKIKTKRCGTQLGSCYALSKFKKKQDLEFLTNIFKKLEYPCEDWIFKAIENNPEEIYFPILTKYYETKIKKIKQDNYEQLKYYCNAVASFKNKESLNLLTMLLDEKNYPDKWYFKNNKENVFRALHKYKVPVYKDLYNKLKPEMSKFVMDYIDFVEHEDKPRW